MKRKIAIILLIFTTINAMGNTSTFLMEEWSGYKIYASCSRTSVSGGGYMQLTPANYAAETWATGYSYFTVVENFNGLVIGVHDSNPLDHYAYVFTNHSYTCSILYGAFKRPMHRNMHWFL